MKPKQNEYVTVLYKGNRHKKVNTMTKMECYLTSYDRMIKE